MAYDEKTELSLECAKFLSKNWSPSKKYDENFLIQNGIRPQMQVIRSIRTLGDYSRLFNPFTYLEPIGDGLTLLRKIFDEKHLLITTNNELIRLESIKDKLDSAIEPIYGRTGIRDCFNYIYYKYGFYGCRAWKRSDPSEIVRIFQEYKMKMNEIKDPLYVHSLEVSALANLYSLVLGWLAKKGFQVEHLLSGPPKNDQHGTEADEDCSDNDNKQKGDAVWNRVNWTPELEKKLLIYAQNKDLTWGRITQKLGLPLVCKGAVRMKADRLVRRMGKNIPSRG